jgi:hypothetical protein
VLLIPLKICLESPLTCLNTLTVQGWFLLGLPKQISTQKYEPVVASFNTILRHLRGGIVDLGLIYKLVKSSFIKTIPYDGRGRGT